MKKLFLFTMLFIPFLSLINLKVEKTYSAFNENDDYAMYILTFPNKNLSTNNYNEYFSNKSVVWIIPHINEIYKNKVTKFHKYYFQNNYNIDNFKTKFIKYIDELGYKKEAIKLKIDGIQITKLKIYCTNSEIEIIKSKIENVLVDKIN